MSSQSKNDLPPPRTQKGMRTVSPPLSNTKLNRLIYLLIVTTALITAYYSYRTLQYKSHVGGWWNLALGRKPHVEMGTHPRHPSEPSVEDRINDLARALGMPSKELASAIAGAVRQYVPPASLSSVAAKETGPVVEALVKGDGEGADAARSAAEGASTGVLGGVASGVESFVGMDEP